MRGSDVNVNVSQRLQIALSVRNRLAPEQGTKTSHCSVAPAASFLRLRSRLERGVNETLF